jgi:hypothetical protein
MASRFVHKFVHKLAGRVGCQTLAHEGTETRSDSADQLGDLLIPASSDAATCHTADFAERVRRNQQRLASQLNRDPGQDRGVVTHRLIFPESRVAS